MIYWKDISKNVLVSGTFADTCNLTTENTSYKVMKFHKVDFNVDTIDVASLVKWNLSAEI